MTNLVDERSMYARKKLVMAGDSGVQELGSSPHRLCLTLNEIL